MNGTDYSKPSRVRSSPPLAQRIDLARFHSWDAMRLATSTRRAQELWADHLGLTVSSIEKQRRPFGPGETGRKNHFADEHETILATITSGVDPWDAIAGQRWMLRKFGYRVTVRGGAVEVDRHQVPADIARHSGELAAFISEALADDVLDLNERRGIHARIERCIRAYLGAEALAEVYAS